MNNYRSVYNAYKCYQMAESGMKNFEIARKLKVTTDTVKNRLKRYETCSQDQINNAVFHCTGKKLGQELNDNNVPINKITEENARDVQSELIKLAIKINGGSHFDKTSYRKACEEIAPKHGLKPSELPKVLGHLMSNDRKPNIKEFQRINAIEDEWLNKTSNTFKKLFTSFIEKNDIIPSNKVLVHFCGIAPNLPNLYRCKLKKEGYEFELLSDDSFKVVKPPSNIVKTDNDSKKELLDQLLDEAISNNDREQANLILTKMKRLFQEEK